MREMSGKTPESINPEFEKIDISRLALGEYDTIGDLLNVLDLGHHFSLFTEQGIDLPTLFFISDQHLIKLGLTISERIKLLRCIQLLKDLPPPSYPLISSISKRNQGQADLANPEEKLDKISEEKTQFQVHDIDSKQVETEQETNEVEDEIVLSEEIQVEEPLQEETGLEEMTIEDQKPLEGDALTELIEEQEVIEQEPTMEPVNLEEPIAEEHLSEEPFETIPVEPNIETIQDEPAVEEPIEEEHMIEEPIEEEHMIEEATVEESMIEEHKIEEPIEEELIVEESIAEQPLVEEPIVEEPIAEEHVFEEPIAEEPMMEEPIEPVLEEPINDDHHTEVITASGAGIHEITKAHSMVFLLSEPSGLSKDYCIKLHEAFEDDLKAMSVAHVPSNDAQQILQCLETFLNDSKEDDDLLWVVLSGNGDEIHPVENLTFQEISNQIRNHYKGNRIFYVIDSLCTNFDESALSDKKSSLLWSGYPFYPDRPNPCYLTLHLLMCLKGYVPSIQAQLPYFIRTFVDEGIETLHFLGSCSDTNIQCGYIKKFPDDDLILVAESKVAVPLTTHQEAIGVRGIYEDRPVQILQRNGPYRALLKYLDEFAETDWVNFLEVTLDPDDNQYPHELILEESQPIEYQLEPTQEIEEMPKEHIENIPEIQVTEVEPVQESFESPRHPDGENLHIEELPTIEQIEMIEETIELPEEHF